MGPIPAPVQPQANAMSFSPEGTQQMNGLASSHHPLQTPSRSPAEYSSPWSSTSSYHDAPVAVPTQSSLSGQVQPYAAGMAQPMVSPDGQNNSQLPFSNSYATVSRTMATTHEGAVDDSFSRWRAPQLNSSQRYNPYLLSERLYGQPALDYQRYGQPYDPYRSNLGFDGGFKPLDSSYSSRYGQLLSYPMLSYPGQAHGRRRRGNLPKHITDTLRLWLQEHLDHPYPSDEQKQIFIQRTGLTISQVSRHAPPRPGRTEPILP